MPTKLSLALFFLTAGPLAAFIANNLILLSEIR